jgi:GDPmannose 4,6-dehydratase
MWLMLQQDQPDDFVIATGETHSVREFAEEAAKCFGFELEWQGSGLTEVGVDKNSGKTIIEKDNMLPTALLLRAIQKIVEQLGKS